MDNDKFTDIIAILMTAERDDLVDYIKNIIELIDVDYSTEESDGSETESEGEEEELSVSVDDNGFYALN